MELNAITLDAFRRGLADRIAGRPMIAYSQDDDNIDACDAYGLGYDPREEQGLTLPEFRTEARAFVQEAIAALAVTLPDMLPRNACEFPNG